jgi:predicted Fe-Mo cluster-binding NifX family protein
MIFTDAFINRAILCEKSITIYQDERLPCLRCRISPNGASFYFYGTVQGVRVRKQLGRYPFISIDAARSAVWQLMTESSNPKPVISSSDVESTTDDITFAALLDLYASHKRMKQSTKISYGGFLRNSGLDTAIVRNVTPNTFLEQFNALFAVYPVKARKVAAIVKSLTRWYSNYSGIQVDDPTKLIGTLTGIGIHSSNARTRRLTNDLLPKFWQVLKSRNELERDAITFCLLTAMRKNEVLAACRA